MRLGAFRRGLALGALAHREHRLCRGLVGWWLTVPGTAGGHRLPDLIGTAPLSRSGAPAWIGAHGRPGGFGALSVSAGANSYLSSPFTSISTSSPFSMGLWVATSTPSATQTCLSIITTTPGNAAVAIMQRGSVFKVEGYGVTSNPNVFSTVTPSSNVWYRLDYTWDGTTNRVYINGKLDVSDSGFAPMSLTPAEIYLGRFSDLYDNWTGWVDDAVIYNRAISADEVYERYVLSMQGYPGLLRRLSGPAAFSSTAAFDPVNFPWTPSPAPVERPSRVIAF